MSGYQVGQGIGQLREGDIPAGVFNTIVGGLGIAGNVGLETLYQTAKIPYVGSNPGVPLVEMPITSGGTAIELGVKLGNDSALLSSVKWLKPEAGFYDVVVHGAPDTVAVRVGNKWQLVSHRSLASYITKQPDYNGGAIRLASCRTGACDAGFAQNLANKLGVPVMAPTDTLFVFPTGKIVIGPNQFTNSGQWKTFFPTKPNSQ
jgi:hypothetical protein